jgi:hypothetical protein
VAQYFRAFLARFATLPAFDYLGLRLWAAPHDTSSPPIEFAGFVRVKYAINAGHFTLARFFGNGTADSTHIKILPREYNASRTSAHCFKVVISIASIDGSTPSEIIAISKRTFTTQGRFLAPKRA